MATTFQSGILTPKALPTGIAELGDTEKAFKTELEIGEVSLRYGFGATFECPEKNGGTPIKRQQINGLLYHATENESKRQKGAITTYDPTLVEKSGGYSIGAILEWWNEEEGVLSRVISLVDENSYDFRTDGPDGIHWKICDGTIGWLPDLTEENRTIIASIDSVSLGTNYSYASAEYIMPFDGYVSCYTNLVASAPVAKVPYTVYCDSLSGVEQSETKLWKVEQGGEPAETEPIGIAAFEAFSNCWHKLYLGVGTSLNGIVLSDDAAVSSTGCGVFLVSSSGLEGSAAQSMLPVKKGCKIRLFGKQTYTDKHITSYDVYDDDRGLVIYNGTVVEGTPIGLTGEKDYAEGTFHLSCVLTAFPMKGGDE